MQLEQVPNRIGETVLTGVHPSGLRVALVPKPAYAKTFAVLATHFGSVDQRFTHPESGAPVLVPDGVAHFLEHKMFEDADGDVSDRFSALGASANASTGFTTTSYIFSTTGNVEACTDLLLDFVQEPYFTPDLVAKEQGIIAQEIRMYDDDPSWRIFFNLLEALYRSHPVRINIAGTEQSIAAIDPAVLYACHRGFYRPGNMCLTMVGALDPRAILELLERDLAGRQPLPGGLHRRPVVDDGPIRVPAAAEAMDVARPKLLLGWKDCAIGGDGRETTRRELASSLALDVLFGRSSPVHEALYAEGLIDDTFLADYTGEVDFGFAAVGGDTDDPDLLERRLLDEIRAFVARGVAADDFERVQNKLLGKFTGMFDSLELVAYSLSGGVFRDVTPFEVIQLVERLRPEDVTRRARELLQDDLRARSTIVPRNGG